MTSYVQFERIQISASPAHLSGSNECAWDGKGPGFQSDRTPVGQHIRQCGSERGKSEFNRKIIDQASSSIKLLTLEALHIRKVRPAINTPEEFRSRKLTLRL